MEELIFTRKIMIDPPFCYTYRPGYFIEGRSFIIVLRKILQSFE